MNFHKWLQRRECGMRPNFGDRDFIMKRVYTSIESYKYWNDLSDIPNTTSEWGAVFNLEFSPEGNVLVAACEKKSILLFDAITTKETYKIPNAHMDNVNCIRFLNGRMFASCSDDTTVALWDLRNLKSKVRSLHGHSNWVKNIEYSHKDNLLVTSGFDGSIFTWDINSHTEQGLIYQKVFHTSGLMRCRIAPDGTKLVICTTGGYLMIIHSLDLTTLHEDLCGFRPTIYRLMQMGHQYIPQAAKFDHVFSKKQKRNRVELVTDFPAEDDAEVILALQIHPMGHSFLSRNISYDEQTEWSCVHDLNEEPDDITESVGPPSTKRKRKLTMTSDEELHPDEENTNAADLMLVSVNRRARNQRSYPILSGRTAPPPPPPPPLAVGFQLASRNANAQPIRPEPFMPDIWAAEVTMQERAERQNRARNSNTNSVTGYNYVYAISSGVLPAAATTTTTTSSTVATTTGSAASSGATLHCTRNRRSSVNTSNNNNNSNDSVGSSSSSSSSSTSSSSDNVDVVSLRPRTAAAAIAVLAQHSLQQQQHEREIYQNPKKLMYFIQESNKGKGFIKEPCFSSDGRIVCSPYDMGVRLLGFSEDCSEYPYHQHLRGRDHLGRRNPKKLHVVKQINSHSEIVLCTKFSPREPLLVTGCRSGQIVWHHPNL